MTDEQPEKKFTKFSRYYRSIEPMLEKPKTRIYTAIVFSFLAISLFGWYAIRPTIQTILYLRKEIEDKSEINRQMEDKIASLIEAQAAYQEIQDQLPIIYEAIPETSEPIDLSLQMRNLTQTTEATYSSMRVTTVPLVNDQGVAKAATTKPEDNSFTVTMVFDGVYLDMEKIISETASMRRLVDFDSINITTGNEIAPEATVSGTTLKMTSSMKAFYNP